MPLIKRYPNRKLYNTEKKQYVTLDGLAELIRLGDEIRVVDYATGEDLTALTLTQIILDQEKKQSGVLPHAVLASLIRAGSQRMSTIQRSLFTSVGFMRLIDGEIRRRIQVLIRLGELAEADGKSLLEKLLAQSQAEAGQAQPSEAQAAGDDLGPEPEDISREVEAILKERNIPTRADLDQIAAQLEALSVKLDSFRPNP